MAQEKKPIIIEHSDFADLNQTEIPDAYVLDGNVRAIHDGIVLTCNKAYYFKNQNYIRAFGNVQMVQGDTLFMNSKYAEYSGDTKQAVGSGSVVMRDPQMTLTTDTIHFDRNIQEAYYNSFGTIRDKENVLTSKSGRYYINQKKFQFLTAVTVTNPTNVIKTNHLDYFTNSGHAYLFGPSTITSKENYIYTEKGFYDTKKNFAHFVKKSFIKYNNRLIEGDSLYYDKNREFASATNNVKITDSINKGIVKGHYAEVFRNQDSLYITKRAVAINLMEKDSVYIHAKVLMVTGKPENRIIRGFDNARFYKIDMSGKCDSIHSNQVNGLTQMIGRPIIWNGESQMTGDIMHLIADKKTEKLDSLKVLNNAFIVQKDTIGTGYNQIKGQNLYGKFKDNKLHEADIIKNTEVIYYTYTDNQELYGIEKNVSSKINIILEDNQISTITFYKKVDGDIYPEKDLPENARKLRGFIWRGDERIKSKDDLFSPEENAMHEAIVKQSKINADAISVPMEIRPETLNYDRDKNKPAEKAKNKDKTKTKKAK
ncbi:OstA-like protein [Flavobacterium sp. '19STA2R22 D10 B1']|uniref:OstA-like protein n=1 Tax=Flavobacterium aerium TaxID=3037261 RepID=UPI00278C1889|nr:OstA-like protein [Flavobacterium sp. '19STA2R22 D10 B1']